MVVVIDVYSKVSKDVNIRMRTIIMSWGRCDCDWRFLLLLEQVRGRKRLPRNCMQTSRLQVFDFGLGDISAGEESRGSNSGACAWCPEP